MACESCGIIPPPMPARMRKQTSAGQSQASILPSDAMVILPIESKNRVRGPHRPLSQPVAAIVTVRAIPGAVRTQWISYSSTRRLVIIWGRIRVVLEASMANVISPHPKRAVVRQRATTLRDNAVSADVSMEYVIPYFGVYRYAVYP